MNRPTRTLARCPLGRPAAWATVGVGEGCPHHCTIVASGTGRVNWDAPLRPYAPTPRRHDGIPRNDRPNSAGRPERPDRIGVMDGQADETIHPRFDPERLGFSGRFISHLST